MQKKKWTDHNRHNHQNIFPTKDVNVTPPKAFLDAVDIMKLADGICGGVLVNDYAVYKKMDQRVT